MSSVSVQLLLLLCISAFKCLNGMLQILHNRNGVFDDVDDDRLFMVGMARIMIGGLLLVQVMRVMLISVVNLLIYIRILRLYYTNYERRCCKNI